MTTRYDATLEQVALALDGQPPYRSRQAWDGLYRRVVDPAHMTDLPLPVRDRLDSALPPALALAGEWSADRGDTVRWLWRLDGGALVETVLLRYGRRATVCVSSQAGCAMGCGFCATGQAGFERNLSTGEIVEQVVRALQAARPRRLSNVVFMGMGEPFANYERVWTAVRRIHDDLGLSARHLTLSTVGLVPGIRRLAEEDLPVNLAVSLHAANDALRDRLVPINRRYPLVDLMAACGDYVGATGRRLSFEWALINAVNDRSEDAAELADLARPRRAHVNLIPLNPTPGYATPGTPPDGVQAFAHQLRALGINTTVRQNRGGDIAAACGQLRAEGAGEAGPHRTVRR